MQCKASGRILKSSRLLKEDLIGRGEFMVWCGWLGYVGLWSVRVGCMTTQRAYPPNNDGSLRSICYPEAI